ncbi:Endonuclease, Uma2 family (restriction endonuclease fold) [Desulfotomaculum arcticum]|uniref:Endonuclease, Uma2 family (Restriction endonuclease fold) n=2 Tax=Desulfotruncus TaxID=2867377 RepID=A0A1I2XNI5_9FIRM|nr:Uma2 family endonuclease [Desulfotruncus arcticus]SFH14952.1 Endonuclease, Uma2 family (restriction endonuclease fold) [Desulfotomaculum arcticum] [Desulfotruncus arcticus DSM 17038]
MQTERLYTYDDYLKIDDDNRYELIGGELILVPAPKTIHQRIIRRLIKYLGDFVDGNNMGEVLLAPTDVLLSEKEKPQPDIFFISKERLNIIKEQHIAGAPDLVIEILSPSTASRDRVEKSKMYYTHGVKEYWLVDPEIETAEILTPGEKYWQIDGTYNNKATLHSPFLTGLEINLKDIFAGLTSYKG